MYHDASAFRKNLWKEFADLVHANPKNTSAPEVILGAFRRRKRQQGMPASEFFPPLEANRRKRKRGAGDGSGNHLDDDDEQPRAATAEVPFSAFRRRHHLQSSDAEVKMKHAKMQPLGRVLWWVDELRDQHVSKMILARVGSSEELSIDFCVCMGNFLKFNRAEEPDLAIAFMRAAQRSLRKYCLPLVAPVHIIADCGAGADLCVELASMLALLFSNMTETKLNFYNGKCIEPPFTPSSVQEAAELCEKIAKEGSVCPAAALEIIYLNRVKIEVLIVVSRGHEDHVGPLTNLGFHQLVDLYHREVNSSTRVVLISLTNVCSDCSLLAALLESAGAPYVEVKLNSARPNLAKMERMLLWELSRATPLRAVMVKVVALLLTNRDSLATISEFNLNVEVASLPARFQRDGFPAVVALIKGAVSIAPPKLFGKLVEIILEFFAAFQETDSVACAISLVLLAENIEQLRETTSSWNFSFIDELDESLVRNVPTFNKVSRMHCGTLTQFPIEILVEVCHFLSVRDLTRVENVCLKLRAACHEAKYFMKFVDPEAKYIGQLQVLREMGLLAFVDEDVVLSTLKATKNLDHAIALLMGEGGKK